jgi:signal transduction histidine kinase
VVTISLFVTALAFNVCVNIYIRSQARSQLIAAAGLLQNYISTDLSSINLEESVNRDTMQNIVSLLRINRTLKQTQFLLDINYAIIGRDGNKLTPFHSNEDNAVFKQDILPSLKKEKWLPSEAKKNRIFYFTAAGKKYTSILYPIKLQNNKNTLYIFLYSDLAKSSQLIITMNIILASILLFAGIVSFIISNILSKKISNPISILGNLARQIGNRDYSATKMNFSDDEIGELGRTMSSMAEKLYAYDNTMKTFLQNASHELRTPLMSIQGYAEGVKYGVVEDQNKAADIIIAESKRLSSIVEDLLYLSKLEGTEDTLNLEQTNAENLIRSCVERVSGVALSTGKIFNLHCTSTDLLFTVDEEKFSRAIINVLANCLRYAEYNIDIVIEKVNGHIVINIVDDGCGISSDDLDKIFERFYKGETGKYGLGLAITKVIIEKHGGTIIAGNNSKKGAFFKITLTQ